MTSFLVLNSPSILSSFKTKTLTTNNNNNNNNNKNNSFACIVCGRVCYKRMATKTSDESRTNLVVVPTNSMTLLFVEMGVGYDQHGQDATKAAMKACRDAISSNSIPAFRRGSIPGVSFDQMKLQIKLGVPRPLQQSIDIEKVKSVFPYGKIENFEVVDGGLICSSGVHVEEMGDKNDDCYIVNAAVYVGY